MHTQTQTHTHAHARARAFTHREQNTSRTRTHTHTYAVNSTRDGELKSSAWAFCGALCVIENELFSVGA